MGLCAITDNRVGGQGQGLTFSGSMQDGSGVTQPPTPNEWFHVYRVRGVDVSPENRVTKRLQGIGYLRTSVPPVIIRRLMPKPSRAQIDSLLRESKRNVAALQRLIDDARAMKKKAESVMRKTQEALNVAHQLENQTWKKK